MEVRPPARCSRPADEAGVLAAPADEAGFTIVEVMAMVMVLAVGLSAVLGLFFRSLDISGSTDARARATAIANREVEALMALPTEAVAMTPGSPATFESASAIVSATGVVSPDVASETYSGVRFDVSRRVVWDAGSSADPRALRRLVVMVAWTDVHGAHEVRADGAHLRPAAATPATPPPGTPTNLVAVVGVGDPTTEIDLTWSAGAPLPTTWEVQRSNDGGLTWTSVTTSIPAGRTDHTATGLASGTTYHWRVRGISGPDASAWSNVASATTATTGGGCTVSSVTVRPSPVAKRGAGLASDVVIEANTSGGCGTLVGFYDVNGGTAERRVLTASGAVHAATIPASAHRGWSVGTHDVWVMDGAVEVGRTTLVVTTR